MQRMHTVAIQHDRFEYLILNFTTGTNAEHYRSQNQIVRDHSLKNSLVVYALKTDYTMPFSKKATIYIQIAGVLLLSAQLSLLWAQSALTAKGGSQMLRPPHELLHEEASATTYFKVARLYGDSNHPHFNPDSSYHYARLASRHFRYLGKRDQKQLEKEGITQRSINRFRSEQKEEALHFAIQKNTIEAIYETDVGELLEGVSDALSGGLAGVLLSGSSSLMLAVMLSQSVNTDSLSHVELVSDGSGSDVKPVLVNRVELLEAAGLDVRSPLGDFELVSLLQVLSKLFDEFLSGNVLDGNSSVSVEAGKLDLHV